MAHIRERSKQFFRKITGRRQKQPDITTAISSANNTPADPSAKGGQHVQQDDFSVTSPTPPEAVSTSIAPEDTSATGGIHIQQEQLEDGYSAISPIPPAAATKSTPEDSSSMARQHAQQDDVTATSPIQPTASSASITPEEPSAKSRQHVQQDGFLATSPIPPTAASARITLQGPSATDGNHLQHEQSRDGVSATTPAAQSLWDRAYYALAKENPGLVNRYDELLAKEEQMANSAPNGTAPLQLPAPHGFDTRLDCSRRQVQLNTVIQIGLQRMADNRATFNIAGHEFDLDDKITKAANILVWSRDWIGNAVRISPEASLVWSGVSLVLPLLTNPTTAAEANRDGFAYVTSRMDYYVALEPMLRRLGQNARVDEALVAAANDHIVDLYRAILDFQLSSILRFYQSPLRTYMRDIVPSRDWDQTRLNIKTREDTVNSDLGRINQLAARQELEFLNKTSEDTHAAMESCLSVAMQQLTVSKKHLTVSEKQLAAHEDAKQERLLEKEMKCLQAFWLTDNGKGATYDWYKDRVESRVEGTCKWFLQHENYQKWLLQESGPLLVSADPGCGKSVLAKYLIDDVLAKQSATVCYFFFKDQDQNTIRQALCALLHQLFFQNEALIQHAMELYNKLGAALVQSEALLWSILRDSLRDPRAGPVIFVIDALDECDESQMRSLIRNLENMFSDKQLANSKFKVLMTSRPYEQVVRGFYRLRAAFQHIHIPGEEKFEAISQEINTVIHHRVEQLAEKHQLSDEIKSSLDSKLLAIGHRTYLWAHLVFDHLDKGFIKTDDGIDAAIQSLPGSVNQAYDQILKRSQEVNAVKKVLSIILAARRPLTLSEMNVAMNLNGQGRRKSIYDLKLERDVDFKSRLRDLCGLFVNVHHDRIYFLHQTAREFLIQSSPPAPVSSSLQWHHSITTRHAHSILAEICMLYLDRLNSTDTERFCMDDHHGALLDYSVSYWDDHFREADFEKGSAMVDLAAGLCTPDLTCNSQWVSIFQKQFYTCSDLESAMNVLFASRFGLTPVTELLLSMKADVEVKGRWGYTALMLAAKYGHEAVARLLLENGANIDAKNDHGWSALMHAADSGHEDATRLLLEKHADVEARDDKGMTALIRSAWSGYEAVTRLLLENGANIDAKSDDGWTALMYVANSGREDVTRLLLEKHADVEAMDNEGMTVLIHSAWSGYEAVTRTLIENGANIEAKSDDGWTALMYAARFGREDVTRLLLEKHADVEAMDNEGMTVLIHSAWSGYEAVTRTLIENGANIEAKSDDGWTALMYAARFGREDVTRLLLEKHADVEAKNSWGMTAVLIAAGQGHEPITRLLLENGANIDAKNDDGWTALMHAARFGQEDTTRLLLENGAKLEARDGNSMTALIHAANAGHEHPVSKLPRRAFHEQTSALARLLTNLYVRRIGYRQVNEGVIRLLLENGADLEAKDKDGKTALMHAVRSTQDDVVRILLENGAAIEARDNDGWTALRHATGTAKQLLLDNGAQVEAKDVEG